MLALMLILQVSYLLFRLIQLLSQHLHGLPILSRLLLEVLVDPLHIQQLLILLLLLLTQLLLLRPLLLDLRLVLSEDLGFLLLFALESHPAADQLLFHFLDELLKGVLLLSLELQELLLPLQLVLNPLLVLVDRLLLPRQQLQLRQFILHLQPLRERICRILILIYPRLSILLLILLLLLLLLSLLLRRCTTRLLSLSSLFPRIDRFRTTLLLRTGVIFFIFILILLKSLLSLLGFLRYACIVIILLLFFFLNDLNLLTLHLQLLHQGVN